MEILGQRFIVVVLIAIATGCASSHKGIWRTNKELDKYRQNGGIEVVSLNGIHDGILETIPTNAWKQVSLQRLQLNITVPSTVCVDDNPGWLGISLWTIRSHYPDSRSAGQLILRRRDKQTYDDDIAGWKDVLNTPKHVQWNAEQKRQIEWRNVIFHQTLETNEFGTLYRRDIRCPNDDVVEIEGTVEKLTDKKTGLSLYPGMDIVIRRIINSIEPMHVATNKGSIGP